MSNLTIVKSKNQIGIGTNKIELTNSQSSALNIKKNNGSYSFLEFNTSSNTIGMGLKMETNDLITFKGTTKITTISKGSLVYLNSTGNWVELTAGSIGNYIQVNSGETGLQWTGIRPSVAIISKSPSHTDTLVSNSHNIILTSDEPIIAGTGNIVLTPSSGSAITIDVTNTSLVTFSSNVCTINPSSNLDASGLTYTVTMASGVIKNSNGDLFNGISGTTYQFNSKDTTTPIFTNLSPATNTYINNTNIGYTLSESLESGTVTFTRTSGNADSSSPHIQNLSGLELNAGPLNAGELTDAPTLVSGTIYTIQFAGIDEFGNVFSTVSTTGITFDSTNPIISSIGPTSSSSVNTSIVSYTLSEKLASGTVTFTRISGNADSNHTVSLAGSELDSGSHNNTTLTNAPTLVTGAVYSIAFNGIDLAGNSASQVSVTNITYDTTAPQASITSHISTLTTDSQPSFTFTTNEIGTLSTNISAGFSSSSTISSTGSHTITFSILSNDTYSGKTITLTDAAGNTTTMNLNTFTVDAIRPTMTITSSTSGVSSGSTSSGTPVSLIFTSNESTTNFSISDITVSNGSLNNSFSGSGTTYTATFTPTASGTCTITVNAGTYTDTAGNNNTAGSLSWTFVAPVNGNTSVDWTLVNTSSANPTSSSSSYADPNYNDGATWIIGGYQRDGRSVWQGDVLYNTSSAEDKKSFTLFEHTSNANAFTAGYYTLSRVYERTGLDHYSGGSTDDPSHGLKLKFNTTVGGDSNTAGTPQSSWAGQGNPWGMLTKMGYETPSNGNYVFNFVTRGGITSSAPAKIIMDFNKYIAITAIEWPIYQYYSYNFRHVHLYYWNESLSTPAWTEIIHFYCRFWGNGSVYLRKDDTVNHGGTYNYTESPTDFNNGKQIAKGYHGAPSTYDPDIPREPLIRLRFPTSLSASQASTGSVTDTSVTNRGWVENFVRQTKYARYYKIEQWGYNHESSGMAYCVKMKGIIPDQPALF